MVVQEESPVVPDLRALWELFQDIMMDLETEEREQLASALHEARLRPHRRINPPADIGERPSLQEWNYPMMANKDQDAHLAWRYGSGQENHRSEWVAWEDDVLSARFSWSSQIHHELSTVPHNWKVMPGDGLFMHLNTAMEMCDASPWGISIRERPLDEPVPSTMWRHPRPQPPFSQNRMATRARTASSKPTTAFPGSTGLPPDDHSIRGGTIGRFIRKSAVGKWMKSASEGPLRGQRTRHRVHLSVPSPKEYV